MKKPTLLSLLALLLGAFLLPYSGQSQGSIPFTIANNSPFSDADLYVAIVGLDNAGNHVWVNAQNSAIVPMSSSYNTVQGPTYNGNTGPGGNSRYAACFTRLSDIPNRTFTLPQIAGCRVFISKGQQLYFYFFGASGAPSGYAGPNGQNPNDPNRDILYEIIELTNNQFGFFGNTTRVDSYKYPMGLELFGNGYQQRTGELKSAADIVAAYKANVPSEFQGTVNNATGEITFPSKTAAFYDGTNGTTPGPQANYFKSYIDAIWAKYANEDLIFNAGNAGVFKGRVVNDRLTLVGQSGAYNGRTGVITRRPTTQEAFEGKGVLATRNGDGDCDLVVQAQLTAAINRHVVNVTTPNPGQQDWYNVGSFYQASPANYYARFWHLPGISVDQKSYGFAYDDVADQSATLHTPQPTKVIATFGGYVGGNPPVGTGFSRLLEAEAASLNSGMTLEACSDAGGGQNAGYVDAGDYLVFNSLSFPSSGTYTLEFRVASGVNGGTISADLNAGTIPLGSTTLPGTGGWQNWTTVSKTVTLNAGTYNFGIYAQTGGYNLNWIRITKTNARTANTTAKDVAVAEPLQVYPNPVVNQLNITSEADLAGSQYQIMDGHGKVVANGATKEGHLDVAELKSGLYMLVITTKDNQKITRHFSK
ncbi:beta-1,3-glucanase family protein [Hymenobacter terrenus]|uniref:beta-1,3-glucanase family protein n=1 Tax=Hymenobacter terrenus TaxID=1629124 RepID=UPI0006195CAE|nr:beta-1,3-glucanase family protein [Hymenobacter terrenus]